MKAWSFNLESHHISRNIKSESQSNGLKPCQGILMHKNQKDYADDDPVYAKMLESVLI